MDINDFPLIYIDNRATQPKNAFIRILLQLLKFTLYIFKALLPNSILANILDLITLDYIR